MDKTTQPPAGAPWQTLLLTLAILVGYFLLQAMLAPLFSLPAQLGLYFAAAVCLAAPAGTAAVCLLLHARGLSVPRYLALEIPRAAQPARWLGLTVLFVLATDSLNYLLNRPVIPEVVIALFRTGPLVLLILAVVILAPVFEEILFRGFLLPGLVPALGQQGAILASALGWTLIHQQYDGMDQLTIFLFGLLLGYVRLRSGSTGLAVAMHALMNGVALLEVALWSGASPRG